MARTRNPALPDAPGIPAVSMPRIRAIASHPIVAVLGIALLIGELLSMIAISQFDPRWVIFLCGILAAATIAAVSRHANDRWIIARRTSQLKLLRGKLAVESGLRANADQVLARSTADVDLFDANQPAMLAYVDQGGVVRHHNRAFARWVGLSDDAIDGHRIEEVLGPAAFSQVEKDLDLAMAGSKVRVERTQTLGNGTISRVFVQYIPHFGADRKVAGLFSILTDAGPDDEAVTVDRPDEADADSLVVQRIVAALERDEFCLFSQSIASLDDEYGGPSFCEVLLRLKVEEENHLPAGSFLPVAEEHGLLPHLDHWVVRKVLSLASAAGNATPRVFMVNVAAATILESDFAAFVLEQLTIHGLDGGVLGFEFTEAEVAASPHAYRDFINRLKARGCHFAVSGFGRNPASLHFFRQLGVSYLKLDGSIVLNVLNSPADLSLLKVVNRVAHAAGMLTVAECVEDDLTRAALKRIDTDFVQGFGISRPRMLGAPESRVPPPAARPAVHKIAA
jgi:EAL domain-containing protein (putative c-di-GMP-specific phosphodiesterase class I)/PAS domain-containing protein